MNNFTRTAGLAAVVFVSTPAIAADDLYITEYVEGSSNNKALEFFNDTGAAIDLTDYEVRMYFNGNASPGLTIDLVGSVADGDVFVLGQSAANADIQAVSDQLAGGGWFNGDDAVVLFRGDTVLDAIGQVGFDPGSQWGSGNASTQNNTLRRKETVIGGDANPSDAFDPSIEWDGFPQDNITGLGEYPDITGPAMVASPCEIQGAGHLSPLDGEFVETTGVVTAVVGNGFFLQQAGCDADPATSDAIFVFTGSAPTVSTGNELEVTGSVAEFFAGGTGSDNLSQTEIISPEITVLNSSVALPSAVVLGAEDRTPPTEIIDNDNFAVFDPDEDGIDFYEALEGMRVLVRDALAISGSEFGATYVVVDSGADATRLNPRGGLTLGPNDFNPERVRLQLTSTLVPGTWPDITTGDMLGDVPGVMSYDGGSPEVLVTSLFTVSPGNLMPENSTLVGDADSLTIAAYNVENLDPNVEATGSSDDDIGDGHFAAIADHLVNRMNAPDIVALQEIQDNDGAENTEVTDASLTLSTLVAALTAAGVSDYVGFDIAPDDDQSGGQPGGNIRNAYLYRSGRVTLVAGSPELVPDPDLLDGDAFGGIRAPLAADFDFNGQVISVVNVHFTAKSASSPLFGSLQPPENGGLARREDQAQAVNDYADARLAEGVPVVVVGDVNEFYFNTPLDKLRGEPSPVLVNLMETLPELERVSFVFEGNSQDLDTILISNDLAANTQFDAVLVNSQFPAIDARPSNHDPLLARIAFATAADTDEDGVADDQDNCTLVANASQLDTNADGIGNACDGDFNDDCVVDFLDLADLKVGFFMPGETDMDGNGNTDFTDLAIFKAGFFGAPGPSGIPNICAP